MATNKMLIDASHPEETRVAVVRGNRIEEFDFESQAKRQLRGNIYLAKVTRVEPSLQAAFVDYGGNRHGFLAFSEIHPDYYQIPVADRQALLEEEAREAEEFGDEEPAEPRARSSRGRRRGRGSRGSGGRQASGRKADAGTSDIHPAEPVGPWPEEIDDAPSMTMAAATETDKISEPAPEPDETVAEDGGQAAEKPKRRRTRRKPAKAAEEAVAESAETGNDEPDADENGDSGDNGDAVPAAEPVAFDGEDAAAVEDEQIESVGQEDALEEVPQRRRLRRQYKIQEVVKRRQIMLVQVVKEERGNKGAALTTYLSLAGRYCVLMPNTARGGGISRKITNANDRKRLKAIAGELEVPAGMGVILRTAGAARTKAEVKRDFEYLMRLWENVRALTLNSSAPCLVYEEGSLIKRSIRDLYDKNIGEIVVQGEDGYREAKDFMRMLMPSHAKNVKPYSEIQSIFSGTGVETQLDKLLAPQVTLKSGGYIVINQTEALVSIDVNSGRATREHSIEDTALQTNLEASDEIARQLRLRDLAGLIVIDFIDMEEKRNNRSVEKRLKDALKNDRARIQVGRISHFGLLEMSRQRIRASVIESTMEVCPHCQGLGHVRSHASIALHVFRAIEDHVAKHSRHDVTVRCPVSIALDVLNLKRMELLDLEQRYGLRISVAGDASLPGQSFNIEKGDPATGTPVARRQTIIEDEDEEPLDEAEAEALDSEDGEADGDDDRGRRRRKRRRRRGRRDDEGQESEVAASEADDADTERGETDRDEDGSGSSRKRRRGKRGGRKNRRSAEAAAEGADEADAAEAETDVTPEPEPVDTEAADSEAMEAEAPVAEADASPAEPVGEEPPTAEDEAPSVTAEESEATDEALEDAAAEDDDQASRKRRTTRRPRGEPAAVAAESAPMPSVSDEEAKPDESAEQADPADEADTKSKRSGWWSKGGFF